jgi:hypothetical protein
VVNSRGMVLLSAPSRTSTKAPQRVLVAKGLLFALRSSEPWSAGHTERADTKAPRKLTTYELFRDGAPLQVCLVGVVELDLRTTQLTVLERWSERRWFSTVEHERVKTYVLALRVGRWLDGNCYVLSNRIRGTSGCSSSGLLGGSSRSWITTSRSRRRSTCLRQRTGRNAVD